MYRRDELLTRSHEFPFAVYFPRCFTKHLISLSQLRKRFATPGHSLLFINLIFSHPSLHEICTRLVLFCWYIGYINSFLPGRSVGATHGWSTASKPGEQSSWGQHVAHLGSLGPRWAPCWPHEPCDQRSHRNCYGQNKHIKWRQSTPNCELHIEGYVQDRRISIAALHSAINMCCCNR